MVEVTTELREKILSGKVQLRVFTGTVPDAWNQLKGWLLASPELKVVAVETSTSIASVSVARQPLTVAGASAGVQTVVILGINVFYEDPAGSKNPQLN